MDPGPRGRPPKRKLKSWRYWKIEMLRSWRVEKLNCWKVEKLKGWKVEKVEKLKVVKLVLRLMWILVCSICQHFIFQQVQFSRFHFSICSTVQMMKFPIVHHFNFWTFQRFTLLILSIVRLLIFELSKVQQFNFQLFNFWTLQRFRHFNCSAFSTVQEFQNWNVDSYCIEKAEKLKSWK